MTKRLGVFRVLVPAVFPVVTILACLPAGRSERAGSDQSAVSASQSMSFQDGIAPSASYAGTRDTYLSENAPASAQGTGTTLRADGDEPAGTSKDLVGLLRWDLAGLPAGSNITAATITVDVTNPSPNDYQVYELLRDWSESDATWSSSAAGTPWEVAGAKGPSERGTAVLGTIAANAQGAYTLSLNADGIAVVQGWADDPSSNHGFIVAGNGTDGLAWSSREGAAAGRPKLSLTFEVAGESDAATPAPSSIVTIAPEADAYVRSGSYASTNYGGATTLLVDSNDGGAAVESYVRFAVGAVGPITRARLRFYVTDGTSTGPRVFKASSAWSEGTVTWSSKPALEGASIATIDSAGASRWVEVDVTGAVAENSVVTFGLTPRSSNGLDVASREAATGRPELVIEVGGARDAGTDAGETSDCGACTPSTVTLGPSADTYVRSGGYAAASYGSATSLLVDLDDGSTVEETLLRFDVPAARQITRARLRVYVTDGSSSGPNVYKTATADWSEATTTWNTKPALGGSSIATIGSTSSSSWVEVDVTGAVTPSSVLSLALVGRSGDGFDIASREAATHRPELILDFEESGGGDGGACTPTTCAPEDASTAGDIVLAAVGDMNPSGNTSTSSASARNAASIMAANVDMFLGLGDFQYTTGTCSTLVSGWDRLWGGLMPKTFHIAGPTHDMASLTDELGYRDHFGGACAGQTTGKSAAVQLLGRSIGPMENYSFDRGNWHFTMMAATLWRYDTTKANAATSWLAADLAAAKSAGKHLLVAWHDPYWTSTTSSHTRELKTRPWVDVLDTYDARIVLSGSQHNVEIFHPQNANDVRNDATGTQQFQVSTGGIGLRSFTNTPPNLIARDSSTWGWLKLTLRPDGAYSWEFVPVMGTFTHAGSRPAAP